MDKLLQELMNTRINDIKKIKQILKEIKERLNFLNSVGLDYLNLSRSSGTLSGGESQRINLATSLGSALVGSLYILDEPTTGLHFEDIRQLLDVINRLVDCGNTAIVIEHNLDVVKVADWIIDMGPEGGRDGGRVVAEGTPQCIMSNSESYTGYYLKQMFK